MDPALDILNRALTGDHGALAFLDRTSSIYVLDATDPSKPKTYGGWNFIHQAMNEVERQEANFARDGAQAGLNVHVQLLATIAQRVARRSPRIDRNLVATCVANASQNQSSTQQAETLINLNSEIREIVMGRIAAMAFDFSFHNRSGTHSSAFSDPVAMEKLCGVLAANAVSSGPHATSHFMHEWIIPSARSLPPFAIACVTYHLALEANSRAALAGTKDALQRLSQQVMSLVVGPVLRDAIMESNEPSGGESIHAWNSRVVATVFKALEHWCVATDLSLPQLRHVCNKVQINIVSLVSDALYSDYQEVLDALAGFLEVCLLQPTDNKVSQRRMTQARYIVEVDEDSFRSVSREDLHRIESKEMNEILSELASGIGLQRFRFGNRQSSGDHPVCRSLTRLAAGVAKASLQNDPTAVIPAAALIDLLTKAASNPTIHVSGLAVEILTEMVRVDASLCMKVLPLLQHRAIVPYVVIGSAPSLAASEVSGVDFPDFESFRDNQLADALHACFFQNSTFYVDSCTSAMEEFCSSSSTVEVSFQLEAALFCMAVVADNVMPRRQDQEVMGGIGNVALSSATEFDGQLRRCTSALSQKPLFLAANPLALAQLNAFIRKVGPCILLILIGCSPRFHMKYSPWFVANKHTRVMEVATELSLSTIQMAETAFPAGEPANEILREMSISPFTEAAKALHALIILDTASMRSPQSITVLGGAWEATYSACNRAGVLKFEDREAVCSAICHVVPLLPIDRQVKALQAISMPAVACIRAMINLADGRRAGDRGPILSRLGDEIRLLSVMVSSYESARRKAGVPRQQFAEGQDPLLAIMKSAWTLVVHTANKYSDDKNICRALGAWLCACLPSEVVSEVDMETMQELHNLAVALAQEQGKKYSLLAVLDFLDHGFTSMGERFEAVATGGLQGGTDRTIEAKRLLENLLLGCIQSIKSTLGTAWTRDKEQGQGQGQAAYESKSEPVPDECATSLDELARIFNVLTSCVRTCPTVLVNLPASVGAENDRLCNRAVESAVTTLTDCDVDSSLAAIQFLLALATLVKNGSTERQFVSITDNLLARFRRPIVSVLLTGACGSLHPTTLGPGSSLLYGVLQLSPFEEAEMCYSAALRNEIFQIIGDKTTDFAAFLSRCSRGELNEEALLTFFEGLWELYQVKELDTIVESDKLSLFAAQLHELR